MNNDAGEYSRARRGVFLLATILTVCLALPLSKPLLANETTDYEYDALGRLIKVTHDDGKQVEYIYDDANNRLSKVATGGNDPPTAVDDSVTINGLYVDKVKNLVANDTDPNGDTLTITSVTQPWNAVVSITSGGSSVLITSTDAGTGTFTYDISDGNGGSDTGTVTVTVNDDGGGWF